jgi:hypothetical protein
VLCIFFGSCQHVDCCCLDSSGASRGILLISGIGGRWEKVIEFVREFIVACSFKNSKM